jgi:hypothetical protein
MGRSVTGTEVQLIAHRSTFLDHLLRAHLDTALCPAPCPRLWHQDAAATTLIAANAYVPRQSHADGFTVARRLMKAAERHVSLRQKVGAKTTRVSLQLCSIRSRQLASVKLLLSPSRSLVAGFVAGEGDSVRLKGWVLLIVRRKICEGGAEERCIGAGVGEGESFVAVSWFLYFSRTGELQSVAFSGRSGAQVGGINTENEMNDPMASQAASSFDSVGTTLASLTMALSEREREIDLLRREVDRYKRESEDARGRTAMVQAAVDRHFAHCGKDNVAIQRLIAGLAEATAQRKEQVAIIERRNDRIAALQRELDRLKRKGSLRIFGPKFLVLRLKQVFSLRGV